MDFAAEDEVVQPVNVFFDEGQVADEEGVKNYTAGPDVDFGAVVAFLNGTFNDFRSAIVCGTEKMLESVDIPGISVARKSSRKKRCTNLECRTGW